MCQHHFNSIPLVVQRLEYLIVILLTEERTSLLYKFKRYAIGYKPFFEKENIMLSVVQMVSTVDCDSIGRGFESHHSTHNILLSANIGRMFELVMEQVSKTCGYKSLASSTLAPSANVLQ